MSAAGLSPTKLARVRRRAEQYQRDGMWPAAKLMLEKLIEHDPADDASRLTLARLLLVRLGQPRPATEVLLPLAGSRPVRDAAIGAQAADLLLACGETAAARRCLKQSDDVPNAACAALLQRAHVYHGLGEQAAALAWMQSAVAAGAKRPQDQHFHAMLLQFTGRLQEAETVLDACLEQVPTFGSAALTRSRLRRQTPTARHIDYLRAQLGRVEPDGLNHAAFHFALFKELDDLGDHAAAWPHLRQANAIMHARNPYDEAGDTRLIEAAMQHMDERACRPDSEPTADGPAPIFIVSMPRSGSTLLERMLGNHSQVAASGELLDFFHQWVCGAADAGFNPDDQLDVIRHCAALDHHAIGRRYLEQTAWRAHGRARFTDKMPNNFALVGMLHRALPGARILNLVRQPMAVCFSNFKAMFADESPHVYDQALLARFYLRHERMRRHWHRVVPGAMLDVSYEALVQSPHSAMAEVLDFCGLAFEDACTDPARSKAPVATPSSPQVQGGIFQHGLDEWQRYADELAPMRRALGELGREPGPQDCSRRKSGCARPKF